MTKTIRKPLKGTLANAESIHKLDPRQVREKAGLELAEMAKLMGMGEVGYNGWERGVRRPGGPAFQLLKVIDADPEKVVSLLKSPSA